MSFHILIKQNKYNSFSISKCLNTRESLQHIYNIFYKDQRVTCATCYTYNKKIHSCQAKFIEYSKLNFTWSLLVSCSLWKPLRKFSICIKSITTTKSRCTTTTKSWWNPNLFLFLAPPRLLLSSTSFSIT